MIWTFRQVFKKIQHNGTGFLLTPQTLPRDVCFKPEEATGQLHRERLTQIPGAETPAWVWLFQSQRRSVADKGCRLHLLAIGLEGHAGLGRETRYKLQGRPTAGFKSGVVGQASRRWLGRRICRRQNPSSGTG